MTTKIQIRIIDTAMGLSRLSIYKIPFPKNINMSVNKNSLHKELKTSIKLERHSFHMRPLPIIR